MLEQNDDKILLGPEDKNGLENYHVCLKMIFHDLSELENTDVNAILDHYKVGIASNGRISITLPRYLQR